MAAFGKNMKLTLEGAHRDATRRVFTEVLGFAVATPIPPLDAYTLDDGFTLGVYFVDAAEALSPEQQLLAAWLEFRVDDVDATCRQLEALGLARHEYVDKAHTYWRAPGGWVFRVAPR